MIQTKVFKIYSSSFNNLAKYLNDMRLFLKSSLISYSVLKSTSYLFFFCLCIYKYIDLYSNVQAKSYTNIYLWIFCFVTNYPKIIEINWFLLIEKLFRLFGTLSTSFSCLRNRRFD